MPNEIIVTGNLATILTKLNRLMRVVRIREATGYELLQPDEEWVYHTAEDERVCPVCLGLQAETVFRGDTIPERFPFYSVEMAQVRPNVHKQFPHLHGECRCWMEMIDPAGILESRLHLEKQLAAG